MNVGIVAPGGLDPSGEERTIPVLRALVARLGRRHDVRVIVLDQPGAPRAWSLDGVPVLRVARPAVLALPRLLRREHRRRPFQVLHAFWATTGGALAVRFARRAGLPILVHVAGGELTRLEGIGYGGGRTWRGRLAARYALTHGTLVTAATAPLCLAAATMAGRVERVPLGVDLTRWPVCPPRPRRDGPLRLVWVGSINRVKGPEVLLATLAALDRLRVPFLAEVIGEDTLAGQTSARAVALGLADRVRFRGFLRQAELHAVMRGADLLVHTAWHEAGPVVALEAALAGLAVAGTAVGHLAEWAPGAAMVVPPGDAGGLARGLAALARDDGQRLALAVAAQARAVHMSADATAARFDELYALVTA